MLFLEHMQVSFKYTAKAMYFPIPETADQQASHKSPIIRSHRAVTKIVTLVLQLELSPHFPFPFRPPLPPFPYSYLSIFTCLLHYNFLSQLKEAAYWVALALRRLSCTRITLA